MTDYEFAKAADKHHVATPRWVVESIYDLLNIKSYSVCWFPFNNYDSEFKLKADELKLQYQATHIFDEMHNDFFTTNPPQGCELMISNPPFGVEWKKVQKEVVKEYEQQGYNGRFGPGLPRINDGALLFNLHLISKMRPVKEGGSRMAIVHNGSPLFTGGAGSGESEIRRYILENDLLEAIVALPTDMFYNTGIATYLWVLTNHKRPERKGKVQLINATSLWQKMKRSLGSKRKELSQEHIDQITKLFGEFQEGPLVKIFDTEDFGYTAITVERPERDAKGKVVKDKKGNPKPDSDLRDTENVPLVDDIQTYFEREVLSHAPDAWIDEKKSKVGYEIPFTRHFYEYQPPRPLEAIDADLKACVARIQGLLLEVVG